MRILINDANILIDLVDLDLLKAFGELPYELYTTDFVYNEIVPHYQKTALNQLVNENQLILIESEVEDIQHIYTLQNQSAAVSFEDCSVWYYSKKMNGILITGDGQLRKLVQRDHIEVRGIIFILDKILRYDLMSFQIAIDKINLLYSLNNRLPKEAKKERLLAWSQQKLLL